MWSHAFPGSRPLIPSLFSSEPADPSGYTHFGSTPDNLTQSALLPFFSVFLEDSSPCFLDQGSANFFYKEPK